MGRQRQHDPIVPDHDVRVMIGLFRQWRDAIHERHGLHEVLELEGPSDLILLEFPTTEVPQGFLDLRRRQPLNGRHRTLPLIPHARDHGAALRTLPIPDEIL